MFAVGVEGLALVNEGDVADGMARLDEATTAALAGEFEEIVAAGWTFCFLLNACERVRDFERAAEWCRKVAVFSRRMHTNFVTLACRAHYGAVLTWQGRWPEAEKSLTEAERLALERPSWGGLTIVRLADLRRRQGRFAEAEELLRRAPGQRARTGGHGRARPRPGRCLDRQSTCSSPSFGGSRWRTRLCGPRRSR